MGSIVDKGKHWMRYALIYFFRLFPIKRNKLFFYSYYGSQYGCNPKYITEYILNRYAPGEYDIVWAFHDPDSKRHLTKFRKVKTMSVRYFYELCTSKVVITNFRTTESFVKRKGQYYVQTWHSSLRLKQIERDAESTLSADYVKMAKSDSQKCDLLLSGCAYSTKTFEASFWYEGAILQCGTPRNDIFFRGDAGVKERIFRSLRLPSHRNIALYAPTFRKGNSLDVYDLDIRRTLGGLERKFGGEWTLLLRLHPHLMNKAKDMSIDERVVDATAYDDVQELLFISDVLITDYSSLMFDFAITARPCFLYVPDLDQYVRNERKLYFDLNELPFLSASSNDDLNEKIQRFDPVEYERATGRFLHAIASNEDGNASERLLQHLERVCFDKKRSTGRARYKAV